MNDNISNYLKKLCNDIQKENYIEGIFITNLNDSTILINIMIDHSFKNYNLDNELFKHEKNGVIFEYHMFVNPINDYLNIDYNNLSNEQIFFFELLTLSDIYVDKNGILTYLKNELLNLHKKELNLFI